MNIILSQAVTRTALPPVRSAQAPKMQYWTVEQTNSGIRRFSDSVRAVRVWYDTGTGGWRRVCTHQCPRVRGYFDCRCPDGIRHYSVISRRSTLVDSIPILVHEALGVSAHPRAYINSGDPCICAKSKSDVALTSESRLARPHKCKRARAGALHCLL